MNGSDFEDNVRALKSENEMLADANKNESEDVKE